MKHKHFLVYQLCVMLKICLLFDFRHTAPLVECGQAQFHVHFVPPQFPLAFCSFHWQRCHCVTLCMPPHLTHWVAPDSRFECAPTSSKCHKCHLVPFCCSIDHFKAHKWSCHLLYSSKCVSRGVNCMISVSLL